MNVHLPNASVLALSEEQQEPSEVIYCCRVLTQSSSNTSPLADHWTERKRLDGLTNRDGQLLIWCFSNRKEICSQFSRSYKNCFETLATRNQLRER